MKPIRTFLVAGLLAVFAMPAAAQAPAEPAANPADVASLDAIITALYDVISGPVGQARDWERMRSLFLPGARLIPTGPTPDGAHRARILAVDEYVTTVGPRLEEVGFREVEIDRRTEQYGNIAHVLSTYSGTADTQPDRPPIRGINSIQLLNDGARWWVVNVFWEAERADNPLPEKYVR